MIRSTVKVLFAALLDKKAKHKVQLKELLSFVMKQTYQPKNPNYVIDALWEQTSVVKAWDAMSQLMVDEELEANERAVLASMVNACVKKASGLSICPKEKSDPNATIKPVRPPYFQQLYYVFN